MLTYAVFMHAPHFSMPGVQRSRMLSASGTTFEAFRAGYCVSYGGFSLIFQKNRHLGSGECAVMSSGRSAESRRAITLRHGSSTAHFGFSVFSRVTPTYAQAEVVLSRDSPADLPGTQALVAHPSSALPLTARNSPRLGRERYCYPPLRRASRGGGVRHT